MIINISGRSDVVGFYSEWFMKRLEAGYVDVRNPIKKHIVSRIMLNPAKIDALVFCTKNPLPLLDKLDYLKDYNCIFQITITPYHQDIEVNVPDKKLIMQAIKTLASIYSSKQVIVRYDPILISDKYSIAYHIKAFEKLCMRLEEYVDTIIISFVDLKKNTLANSDALMLQTLSDEQMHILCSNFQMSASKHQMFIQTCGEPYDLSIYGISKTACLSAQLIFNAFNKIIKGKKGRLREHCNCLESVDIGSYNSCGHFCKYCYANYAENQVEANMLLHNPNSSLMLGELSENDIIKIRQ